RLLRSALRAPRRTVRLRLTILFAMLFLVSGAGLLTITYLLVSSATGQVVVGTNPDGSNFVIGAKAKTRASAPKIVATKGKPGVNVTTQQLKGQPDRDRPRGVRQPTVGLHGAFTQC